LSPVMAGPCRRKTIISINRARGTSDGGWSWRPPDCRPRAKFYL